MNERSAGINRRISGEPRMPRRTRQTRIGGRGGYSLVEMLVMMTIVSFVLTSVGIALHSLFRTDRNLRNHIVQDTVLARLSLQLRRDAHRSAAAELVEGDRGASRLTFSMSDGEIVAYSTESQRIVRVASRGEDVLHREVYALPDRSQVRWELETQRNPPLLALEIVHSTGAIEGADDALRRKHFDAVVGLNREYTDY